MTSSNDPAPAVPTDPLVERFVAEARASRKYRRVCEATLRDLARTALERHKRPRDAFQAARTVLHGIQAVYLDPAQAEVRLEEVRRTRAAGDAAGLQRACLALAGEHTSARERSGALRVPDLSGAPDVADQFGAQADFYRRIFALTGGPPRSVIDVGCGAHPFHLPWMGLAPGATYRAYEITGEIVEALNHFFGAAGVDGQAFLQDVVCDPPAESADLAFLMKVIPCLERRRKGAARAVLEGLRVRWIVATFPVRSLSGRDRGMPENYRALFARMLEGLPWQVTEATDIADELVFVVRKD